MCGGVRVGDGAGLGETLADIREGAAHILRLRYGAPWQNADMRYVQRTRVAVSAMVKGLFTNVMTEGDDKTRWVLAYALFGLCEVFAVIHAYKSLGHNVVGYFAYGLPILVLLPIFSARTTMIALKRNPIIQTDSALRRDISLRLWMLVVVSYTLFIFAVEVGGTR